MCKQNIYLLECKSLTPMPTFYISANSCQLFEQMNVKYLLGGTHRFLQSN